MDLKPRTVLTINDDGKNEKSSLLLPKIDQRKSRLTSNTEISVKQNKYGNEKLAQLANLTTENNDGLKYRDKATQFKTNVKLPILATSTLKDEALFYKHNFEKKNNIKDEVFYDKRLPEIQQKHRVERKLKNTKESNIKNESIFLPKIEIGNTGNERQTGVYMRTPLRSLQFSSTNAFEKPKTNIKNDHIDKDENRYTREKMATLPEISSSIASSSSKRVLYKTVHREKKASIVKIAYNDLESILNKRNSLKKNVKKFVVRFSKLNNHHQIEEIRRNSQFINSFLSDEERSLREKSLSRESNDKQGPHYRFDFKIAENIIRDILENFALGHYSNEIQNASEIGNIVTFLSDFIKNRIKEISDQHHKLVVNVTFYTQENQGIILASKCLWDNQNDSSVTVRQNYQNYIIITTLYAVNPHYFELQ